MYLDYTCAASSYDSQSQFTKGSPTNTNEKVERIIRISTRCSVASPICLGANGDFKNAHVEQANGIFASGHGYKFMIWNWESRLM
jgi:hypothetical protein